MQLCAIVAGNLSVNWQDRLKCGFSYGIGFNISDYKAVVTKYNNPEGLLYNNHTGSGHVTKVTMREWISAKSGDSRPMTSSEPTVKWMNTSKR